MDKNSRGTKVVITIDTEPDNMWKPDSQSKPHFRNISELSKLQKLFDRFKVKPTYLVTFSVANSREVTVLQDIAKAVPCEIGAHLHALETPAFKGRLRGDGSYLHQYSLAAQREKLATLDESLGKVFGYKPVSYRAGRWSLDDNAILTLSEHGYLVDTSVLPGISWERDGGINFKKFSGEDSFIGPRSELLEIPVSTLIIAPGIAKFIYLNTPNWTHAEGILRRIAGFNILVLDPCYNTYDAMKSASDILLGQGRRVLNIAFHSSAIIAGGTPYTMSEKDVRMFFERLERLLEYLVKAKGLEGLTLKEFYNYRRSALN